MVNEVGDDRDTIVAGDRVLLIVENDLAFSRFLLDTAREKGFKGLVTSLGATALALAREYKPTAITLDIFLSDIEGWRVLERLKNDIGARHIPICVISTDEARERALSSGALRFVAKPIQSKGVLDDLLDHLNTYTRTAARNVLVVEHDEERLKGIMDSIDGAEDLRITNATDGEGALRMMRERRPDCIVLNPGMPGLDPTRLVEESQSPDLAVPVLVFSEEHEARGDGPWAADREDPRRALGAFARAAARPEHIVPAPQHDEAAESAAAHAGRHVRIEQAARRQARADRRRRRAQYFRADVGARGVQHADRLRR